MEFQIPYTNWMWLPEWKAEDKEEPCLVYFRKVFLIKEKMTGRYEIEISADSRYKLYVNGELSEIGPSKGDRMKWYYDTVDISPYVKEGENCIAVEVLRYPMMGSKGNYGIFRTETPGLYVKDLQGILKLSGDASWKCRKEAQFSIVSENPYFAPLQILEERRGNHENAGWKESGYEDREWEGVKVYTDFEMPKAVSPRNLLPRPIPYMRKEERHFLEVFGRYEEEPAGKEADCPKEENDYKETTGKRAEEHYEGAGTGRPSREDWNRMLKGLGNVRIPADSRLCVEINAGEEMTGFLKLVLCQGGGAMVKLLTSEGYVQKAKDKESENPFALPEKKDRCDWEKGELKGYTDTYYVDGYGREELPECYEPFWFRTFRFVRLEIVTQKEPLIIRRFDYKETGYPLEVKTWVKTSDETLDGVWDISLRTLKRCMHETYEDCPFYEQLQYAMDSRSQILYTYCVSGDDRLARNCMDDFRRSQRYDGMINCSYPTWGPNVIPGFSVYYILMLYDHMMYFGDKTFLREHMGAMDGILEFFNRNLDERGLVGKVGGPNGKARYWSFIDWTAQWDAVSGMPTAGLQGPITMESLLYVIGLSYGARVAEYLGREDTAKEYRARAEVVRRAVREYCRDEEGVFIDGPGVKEYSQHCQVFALLADCVSIDEGAENLLQTLENKEKFAQCSVAMAYYLYRALEKAKLYEKTKECWELWRQMVRDHLTTCVEDGVNGRSDCHAWGSLILFELPSIVLGVHPKTPGYEEIAVTPNPGYLDWAEGEVITPKGVLHVSWKKDAEGKLQEEHYLKEKCR